MTQRSEPIIFVKIVPRGTKGIRVDLTNRVIGWTFDDNESKADKLTLTVDNWDLSSFDTRVWAKGTVIEFSFGYVGNMAPARQLVIKSVKGATKLKIEAYSKAYLMDRLARCRVFENLTVSEAVERIAGENGFGESVRDIEDTKEKIPFLTQAAISDAKFLRRMAAREGFEFYVDFDGLHFHKRRVGQRPLKSLVWYSDNTGTLKDFNIDNDVASQPSFTRTSGRDPKKKKNFSVEVDHTKDFSPTLGASEVDAASAAGEFAFNIGAIAMKASSGFAVQKHLNKTGVIRTRSVAQLPNNAKFTIGRTGTPTKAIAKRGAKGKGFKRRHLAIKMKAIAVGDPQILAKSVVRIEGVGKRLSGNYYVKSASHKGGAGYVTNLKLLRDGHNEQRESATLFRRGRGGGGASSGCTGAVSAVRKAIAELAAGKTAAVKDLIGKGGIVDSGSLLIINDKTAQLQKLSKLMSGKTQPSVIDPLLNSVWDTASEFRAVAVSGLTSIRIARLGNNVQAAVEHARDACKKDQKAQINNQKPNDSEDQLVPFSRAAEDFKNLSSFKLR